MPAATKPHAPTTASRTPLAILAAAGLAILTPAAHAQSTIEWASPVDGDFGVAGNWLPMAVPGAMDTAVLGGVGPYTVLTGSRSVGMINLSNPDAAVAVAGGRALRIGGVLGPGRVVVNAAQDATNADLIFEDGAEIGATLVLNTAPGSTDLADAQVYWSLAGTAPR